MNIIHEKYTDVVTIRFLPTGTPVSSEVVNQDVILDFAEDGRLAAIEVLSASKHFDVSSLRKVVYEVDEEPLLEMKARL